MQLVDTPTDVGAREGDPLSSPQRAFYAACRNGDEAEARCLFLGGAVSPVLPDETERLEPLSWVVFYKWSDVLEAMLEAILATPGADAAPAVDRAVAQACRQGSAAILEMLADRFPAVARAAACRELAAACRTGRVSVAKLLVKGFPEEARGAVALIDPRDSTTPFSWACRNELAGVVRLLIQQFPDEARQAATTPDLSGRTPLARACEEGHEAVVKLLLQLFPDSPEAAPVVPQPPPELVEDWGSAGDGAVGRRMLHESAERLLTQQGYRLVGSHSAVKQCRWTKSGLRGEGQCYKHAFYGIRSHGCMEGTPSLACANKCTFCWRNHANPVATSWVFQTDDPEYIVEESIRQHLDLIAEAAKSPLALPERLEEARVVRHMALSLVGEPVFYPRIGELVAALHRRRISTFLVTNGQFPEQLEQLPWVTQLYVSVDAPNEEELRAVGRPLFRDHFERLRRSLAALAAKRPRQRTVCRLTVLKPLRMDDEGLEEFADLIRLSDCDFVEVKGATYSGWHEEDGDGLSMASVPWHEEVCEFANALRQRLGDDYGLACEHEHSCSVLLARRDRYFTPTGRWRTWIDFEAFAEAAHAGKPLDAAAFTLETPSWALADGWRASGAESPGFDPAERRRRRRPTMAEYADVREARRVKAQASA